MASNFPLSRLVCMVRLIWFQRVFCSALVLLLFCALYWAKCWPLYIPFERLHMCCFLLTILLIVWVSHDTLSLELFVFVGAGMLMFPNHCWHHDDNSQHLSFVDRLHLLSYWWVEVTVTTFSCYDEFQDIFKWKASHERNGIPKEQEFGCLPNSLVGLLSRKIPELSASMPHCWSFS